MPGIGTLLIETVFQRDFPTIQAIILVIAVSIVIINLLVDLLLRTAGPAHPVRLATAQDTGSDHGEFTRMTTTNTGQGLAAADAEAEAQLLEMRPKQTQLQKIVAFTRSKPLGAVSAIIILLTILAAVVSYALQAYCPTTLLTSARTKKSTWRPSPAHGWAATIWAGMS